MAGDTGRPATSRRRRGTGHELREVVLAVAAKQLELRGDVESLTMRVVASEAGVTAPAVYRHFPDKQSLVREVVTRLFAEFSTTLQQAASGHEPPDAALHAMSQAYVTSGLDNPGQYRVLFSTENAGPAGLGMAPGTPHPGAASFEQLIAVVAACLPESARSRAHVLGTGLWAALHGIVDLRITKPEMPWPPVNELITPALVPIRQAANNEQPQESS